jgi:phage virion morphogenesis protein
MATLTITYDDRQFVEYFTALGRKLGNLQPVMDDIGAVLESRVNQRFATKTDPTGAAWEPWKPSTARRRAKEGRGSLLEYSRRLLDSLNHASGPDWLEIGFGVSYAGVHEFGARVEVAARSQRAYFKVDTETGRSRFATKKKANFEQWVTIGAHGFDIPPRRMLTADGENLGEGDREAVLQVLRDWLAASP